MLQSKAVQDTLQTIQDARTEPLEPFLTMTLIVMSFLAKVSQSLQVHSLQAWHLLPLSCMLSRSPELPHRSYEGVCLSSRGALTL